MKIKINVDNGSISAARVASLAGGRLAGAVDAADKKDISCVCTDSREVCPGALFVAIAGERTDGHKYIGAAVLSGAAAVLVEKEPADVRDIPIPVIVTDATVPALSRIAAGFASGIKARRVAVTGSVGKTTTKEFIASVLSQGGSVYRTEGNRNSVIGMPLTMLATPPDAEYAVLEMGMSGFGEIEAMSLAARPDIAVITNIGSSHLEYLGTRENIAKAKLEIRAGLAPGGMLLLNGDEPLLADVGKTDSRAAYFSASGNTAAEHYITGFRDGGDGCEFDIVSRGHVIKNARIPVHGRHNAQAALIAAAVGLALGLDEEKIRAGLLAFRPADMRQNFTTAGGINIIEDCYNASPESMRAAIDVLIPAAERLGGIPAAVLGDMGELGADSPAMHREVGRYFAERGGELLIAYGPRSAETARGASEAGLSPEKIVRIPDIDDPDAPEIAAAAAKLMLGSRDLLLIKASRAVRAERIVEALGNTDKEQIKKDEAKA